MVHVDLSAVLQVDLTESDGRDGSLTLDGLVAVSVAVDMMLSQKGV